MCKTESSITSMMPGICAYATTSCTLPFRSHPAAGVEQVVYLPGNAPVLASAKQRPLEDQKAAALLSAARAVPAAEPEPRVVVSGSKPDTEENFKAATRNDAIGKVKEQNDIVMGKAM